MISFLSRTLNPELIRNHGMAIMLIWVLFAMVPAAFFMFMIFLFVGSFTIVDLNLNQRNALLLDALLSTLFFLQHSILIRPGIRQRFAKLIPSEYGNAFYGLTSGIALLMVLIFWQKTPTLVADIGGIGYWVLRGLFFLWLAGFAWGVRSLGSFDALGVKPLMRHISGREGKPQEIIANGPYRWVRHPLYLFVIFTLWSCPVLTPDRLMFNIMWTLWIVIGTYLEDRDLHREFGKQYLEYSSQVPMLIPYKMPKFSKSIFAES
jgi:methanethiol S-methyltransferase